MSLYDKASLALIPSGYKAGTTDNLYSVLPANGNGDFNATRGSSATRVNKDGFIESVVANTPRLDYPLIDGVVQSCPALLLESSRTNSFQRSEELDNAYWGKNAATITADDAISPDGGQTADKLNDNGVGTSGLVEIYRGVTVSTSTDYTYSVFAKKGSVNFISLRTFAFTNPTSGNTYFNLENGTIGTTHSGHTAKMQNYGNGWYRCSITFTTDATDTSGTLYIRLNEEDNEVNVDRDGTKNVYLWGAQLEEGSYETSYIPTSGSTVTRLTEVSNAAGTVSDFNSVQGVLFADLETVKTSGSRVSLSQAADPFAERVSIDFNTATNIRFFVEASDDNNTFNVAVDTVLKRFKIAVKWNGVNISVFIDGFEAATDTFTGFTADTLDRLQMTAANGIGSIFEGDIYQLMTFNEALTDSELEQITSYRSFGEMAKGQLYTIE